jgi:hypothetical protein
MTNPMIRIHDIATGEVVDREMTAAEAAEHAKSEAKFLADEQDKVTKAEAKDALLARLGITADEAALLLG